MDCDVGLMVMVVVVVVVGIWLCGCSSPGGNREGASLGEARGVDVLPHGLGRDRGRPPGLLSSLPSPPRAPVGTVERTCFGVERVPDEVRGECGGGGVDEGREAAWVRSSPSWRVGRPSLHDHERVVVHRHNVPATSVQTVSQKEREHKRKKVVGCIAPECEWWGCVGCLLVCW